MTMGQKIVVLRDGRVEQAGTPLELYDTPRSLFVAGFIGTPAINVIGAHIKTGEASALLADGVTHVPVAGKYGDVDGKPVLLGIRPEHMEFVQRETPGSDTVVICNTPVGQIFASSKTRTSLQIGETIALRADDHKALLFNADSQLRLASLA